MQKQSSWKNNPSRKIMERSAQEYAKALSVRVERLRKRGLCSMRGRLLPESLRESHAREFIARSWIVPAVRKVLGNDLRAVLLTGSTQISVRKGTKRRKESDLDIIVVVKDDLVENRLEKLHNEYYAVESSAAIGIQVAFGFNCHFQLFPQSVFAWSEGVYKGKGRPIQVLYGQKWVQEFLGNSYLANMPRRRREELVRQAEKYNSLPPKKI